jgi:phospholipid transport system substrate-binding protein
MNPSRYLPMLAVLAMATVSAQASTDAAERFLRQAVGDVVGVARQAPDGDALAKNVTPVLLRTIDFDTMTRRAVGPGWRKFPDASRARTVELFTTLVIRSYSDKFTPGELPEVVYKKPVSPAAGRVEVPTATRYKGSDYEVVYRLEETPKGWRITDVVIEGVSMVRNYRSQIDARYKSGGVDAVIEALSKSVGAAQ